MNTNMNVRAAAFAIMTLAVGLVAGSPVEAGSRNRHRDPLPGLAREVESSARYVHLEAERTTHHGTPLEARALRRLHELESSARLFNRELRAQGPYSPYVERSFNDLGQAYRRAQYAMRWLHPYRDVEDEFARMDSLMRDLGYEYGARLASLREGRRHHDGRRGTYGYVAFDDEGRDGHASVRVAWDHK